MALLKNKLVLIMVLVLLLGGGGAYYFLFIGKKETAEAQKRGHRTEKLKPGDAQAKEAHGDDEEGDESKHDTEDEEADGEEEDAAEEASGGGHGNTGEKKGPLIEPFVVNLADPGSRRYLRLNIKLELKKPDESEPLLEARMPQVRDTVLLLLSSKTSDQLLNPEGKLTLRQELIGQLNKVLKKKRLKKAVKNLYFTEFLIQ